MILTGVGFFTPGGGPEAVENPPGKILNSKSEILNNLKIQMFKIPNVSVI